MAFIDKKSIYLTVYLAGVSLLNFNDYEKQLLIKFR